MRRFLIRFLLRLLLVFAVVLGGLLLFRSHYRPLLRELAENGDMAVLCRSGAEADAAAESGRTAAFLSVEGADLLDCDTEKLRQAAAWGVRLVNPVWNNANALSGSCADDPDRGLSAQGRGFIREMERLGIGRLRDIVGCVE